MINPTGDSASAYVPSHPIIVSGAVPTSSISGNFSKLSGNALYWILQITVLLVTVSFNVLCNPVVWFLIKTLFNILTEVFVYLVLGVCSFLISVITHVDDYYTRGKNQAKLAKKFESNLEKSTDFGRDGVYIQNCNVKRFVEKPIKEF